MPNIINFAKKQIVKCAKVCYDSPANFWQTAAIFTISVYHLCQIAIIAINKNTPKREKAFLIPQEAMDGVINLATFVVFASSFKKFGRFLVKKDVVKPFNRGKKVFAEEFATTTNLLGSLLAVNIVSPIIRNKFGASAQTKIVNFYQKKQMDTKPLPKQNYQTQIGKNFGNLKIN